MDGLGRLIKQPRIIQMRPLAYDSTSKRTTAIKRGSTPTPLMACSQTQPPLTSRAVTLLHSLGQHAVPQLLINTHGNCETCQKASVALPCGTERRTTLQGKVMSRSGTILSIGSEERSRLVTLP